MCATKAQWPVDGGLGQARFGNEDITDLMTASGREERGQSGRGRDEQHLVGVKYRS